MKAIKMFSLFCFCAFFATAQNKNPKFNINNTSYGKSYTIKGVVFNMITVEGGTFTMGATPEQFAEAGETEKPAHETTVKSFMIAETEVTQKLWKAIMGTNPSWFKDNDNPVESMSFKECQTFIKKLNKLTGENFRLPTEAEWEYAARGGNKSEGYKYSGSNTAEDVAWTWRNSGESRIGDSDKDWNGVHVREYLCQSHPVKSKRPNELGIYDMSGNVMEWCNGFEPFGSITQAKNASDINAIRGGNWHDRVSSCRNSSRYFGHPTAKGHNIGFRLAM